LEQVFVILLSWTIPSNQSIKVWTFIQIFLSVNILFLDSLYFTFICNIVNVHTFVDDVAHENLFSCIIINCPMKQIRSPQGEPKYRISFMGQLMIIQLKRFSCATSSTKVWTLTMLHINVKYNESRKRILTDRNIWINVQTLMDWF
jgi:hypothetical protein